MSNQSKYQLYRDFADYFKFMNFHSIKITCLKIIKLIYQNLKLNLYFPMNIYLKS